MNLAFNYFGQNDTPELILCNPDDTEIGVIVSVEEFSPTVCFSDISEISYKIYKTDDETYNHLIYDKHVERRQVKVVGTGYFIIKSSPEFEDEKGKYKAVQAQSCEAELNNIEMPYIDGTYCLYSAENFGKKTNDEIAQQEDEYLNENCILYEIMSVIPSWTLSGQIDFVEKDKYIELAKKFRTFEGTASPPSVYSFFKNEIQDSYECFVGFDIEQRQIRILTYDDVFEELSMIISEANILNSCEISTPIDNYVNCLNVSGTNGVNIATYNPLGNSLIYNFDHDINIGLIDGVLKEALIYWKNSIQNNIFYSGLYCDTDVIQKWINASIKKSTYKKNLLEAIGTGEETKINSLLNDTSFLTNIGLTDDERTNYIKSLQDSGTNTSLIDNIFIELSFKRVSMLSVDKFNSYEGNIELYKMKKFLYSMQELQLNIESEINSLNSYLNGYNSQVKALKVTVVETEENQQKLDQEIEKVNLYITTVNNTLEEYEDVLNTVNDIVNNISSLLSKTHLENQFQHRFNEFLIAHPDYNITVEKLYANLTRYIKQQTYTDENIIVTDAMGLSEKFKQEEELYNSSVSLLESISIPAYEISVGAEAFLFSNDFKDIIEKLNINSALYVDLPNGDVPLFHLLKIIMNYDENTCEMVFGNRLRLSDPTKIFSDLQQNIASSASIIAAERVNWGVQEEKVNELIRAKDADIDTTFRAMSNSFNKTTFGDDGFRCYAVDEKGSKTFGMWCANGTMMFTDGETPKMAIGRILKADGTYDYGFYGRSLIANSVSADKLVAGALSKGTNYVRNGSFEADINYWSGGSIDDEHLAPLGKQYLILDSGDFSIQDLSMGNTSTIVLTEGTYTISFYCRRSVTGTGITGLDGACVELLNGEEVIAICNFSDEEAFDVCNGTDTKSHWARCHSVIKVPEAISNPKIRIYNGSKYQAAFDGIMLEKAGVLHDYTPHITETYAKYTIIDDGGITVYDGKIQILNNNGIAVFKADNEGNLNIIGKLTASTGSNIAGWETNDYAIYKGYTGMMSEGAYAFFAGAKDYNNTDSNGRVIPTDPNFSVTHDGSLVASKATVTGSIYASYLQATTGGQIANWTITKDALTGGKLVLTKNGYITEFDGRSLRFGKAKSSGIYSESDFGSCISMMKSTNNVFNDPTSDNLSIAGRTVIQFGLRGNSGSFEEVGRMYKFSYTGGSNLFNKNVLDINSVKLSNVIIGNIVYRVSADTVQTVGLSGITPVVCTSVEQYLRLDPFTGTISGLFDWIF